MSYRGLRRGLAVLTIGLIGAGLSAQTPESEGFGKRLFIDTRPMGARVVLDDEESDLRTPCTIDVPAAGRRRIRLEKTGFEAKDLEIDIRPGEVVIVETELAAIGAAGFFPDGVVAGPDDRVLPGGGYGLAPGWYRMSADQGRPVLEPLYPAQRWIDGLNLAVPAFTVLTGSLFVAEATAPRTDGRLSPFTIGSLATDLLLLGADIGLHIHRARWRRQWRIDAAAVASAWADEDFRLAEQSLEAGAWSEARDLFDRFVQRYPLDDRSADALYRSARLAYLEGDLSACRQRLERLIDVYPRPSIWDRAWRLQAELALKDGDRDAALAALDRIHGIDDAVDLEGTSLKKAGILTEIAAESGNEEDRNVAIAAWEALAGRWPESPMVDEYRRAADQLRAESRASSESVSP